MKCTRCPNDIELDAPKGATICGSCANELRQEQDALEDQAAFDAQDRARAELEANLDAYRDALSEQHFDDGGGYRYA